MRTALCISSWACPPLTFISLFFLNTKLRLHLDAQTVACLFLGVSCSRCASILSDSLCSVQNELDLLTRSALPIDQSRRPLPRHQPYPIRLPVRRRILRTTTAIHYDTDGVERFSLLVSSRRITRSWLRPSLWAVQSSRPRRYPGKGF